MDQLRLDMNPRFITGNNGWITSSINAYFNKNIFRVPFDLVSMKAAWLAKDQKHGKNFFEENQLDPKYDYRMTGRVVVDGIIYKKRMIVSMIRRSNGMISASATLRAKLEEFFQGVDSNRGA